MAVLTRYFFTLAELLRKHGHRVIPFTAANPNNEPSEWERYFPRGARFRASRSSGPTAFLIIHTMPLNQFDSC